MLYGIVNKLFIFQSADQKVLIDMNIPLTSVLCTAVTPGHFVFCE